MIEYILSTLDFWLSFLPALVRVLLWGGLSGATTMLLYRKLSSQQKIAAVVEQSRTARRDLSSYDGDDPRELLRRVWHSLRFSLAHVRLVSLPAIVASLPVVVLLWWMNQRYSQLELVSFGPVWMRGWLFAFMAAAASAAIAIKLKFGIR